ncbi:MAG TPA: type VI secretion system baseplate subunit TssG [Myxococcaceae bacterium]|nr:type VI secretion system baseplate subunit TssG [Myxococcaceae bacterium]
MEEEQAFTALPLARLGFLGLVRLLEQLTQGAAPIGQQGPAEAEAIRFRHDPSLGFSPGDISRVQIRKVPGDAFDSSPPRRLFEVTTTFLGLTGSVGPLPSYIAEELTQEDPDRAVRGDFLDLFHHRLISLLYRELVRLQLWGEQTTDLRDPWACRLLGLAGFDVFEKPISSSIPVARLLRLTPLLAQGLRSAGALKTALEEVLGDQLRGAQLKLREFAGTWVTIEAESRTRLGVINHELGRTALVGQHVFDRAGGFEIHVGPVSRLTYERFLPGGDLLPLLQEVIALFLRDPLSYRVVVELDIGQAPRLRLKAGGPERLGQSTWLGTRAEKTLVTTYPYAMEDRPQTAIEGFSPKYYSARPLRGVAYAR